MNRTELLKQIYQLGAHVEGGSFSEVYTSSDETDGRPITGSIYFLLEGDEISHLHEIDCDEIWYYHEGCGMKITVLTNGAKEEFFLGANAEQGERTMVEIRKGCIFGAENLDPKGYTFISCMTAPKFRYEGFRLVKRDEVRQKYSDVYDEIAYLAY